MLGMRHRSRFVRILQTVALVLLTNVVMAQNPSDRYLISRVDVAKVLNSIGVDVSERDVHLPTEITATTASPQLEIAGVQPITGNRIDLELRCHTSAECLAFVATLDVKDSKLISSDIRLKIGPATAASKTTRQGDLESNQVPRSSSAPDEHLRLKAGSRVVLLIRDGHLDIHLQVMAIDSGVAGQQVRVSTLDRKKIFHATVTGERTVTGVME